MAGRTQDFSEFIGTPDALASAVSNRFVDYEKYRRSWVEEKKELRNYLFATDTTRTTNATLPWKNSTTTPKLTQLRDNLHANYMAALFPNDEWLLWEGDDEDAEAELECDYNEDEDDPYDYLASKGHSVEKIDREFINSSGDTYCDWIREMCINPVERRCYLGEDGEPIVEDA